MGEKAFGVAPGAGEIWVTLRTLTDAGMEELVQDAEALINDLSTAYGLIVDWSYHDVFSGCVNDPDLTAQVSTALQAAGFALGKGALPMRWSEDFGCYADIVPSVMLFPGSGIETPALHNPDYDFPDDLICVGTEAIMAILQDIDKNP